MRVWRRLGDMAVCHQRGQFYLVKEASAPLSDCLEIHLGRCDFVGDDAQK